MATKQQKITPTLTPTSREDLLARRDGVVAPGPSGAVFRVVAHNLMRQAFQGTLPQRLRHYLSRGEAGINQLLAAKDEELGEIGDKVRDHMDALVLATIVEPTLTKEDLGPNDLTGEPPLLHPADYKWALGIANGDVERDGEGRFLWGREPLNRLAIFRAEHECPDDCLACNNVIEMFSTALLPAGGM